MTRRFLAFACAGTIGFAVDAMLLMLSQAFLGPFAGRLVSVLGALLVTWSINRRFAFADRASDTARLAEFTRYGLAMLPGATVNWLCYGFVVAMLPRGEVTLLLALAIGSLAGLGTNLTAANWLVFRIQR